ncbi:hypothetical protein ACGF7U_00575 [Micromonospora sp. NPDC047670]|uniref:hypothetical protein n=1 Tax=Micromonospora sp. NPDC047670 TaxID=3364252 RepID=UPI0037245E4F
MSYDEYVLAAALTLARLHRPLWSWRHWRRICRQNVTLQRVTVVVAVPDKRPQQHRQRGGFACPRQHTRDLIPGNRVVGGNVPM